VLLSHLAHCAACRAEVAATDPSRLFDLLALEPVPSELLERLSFAVEEAVDGAEAGLPGGPAAAWRRVRWPAASLAASLVLAGFLATYVSRRDAELQVAPAPPATAVAGTAATAPGFELLSSPGEAQVVDLAVGEVRLVMIFDAELDL
jgi:hypothetical protein